ncbi:hypothetical protein B0H17DRAFT_914615, partial [Mycena rosella]
DHLACRTDLEGGCKRCIVAPATVCCELCTPTQFLDFGRVDILKTKQQPKRAHIADYKAERVDFALRDDLHAFRKTRTIDLRGRAYFRNFGPGYIMPDDVLQCIVDCAHFHKILTAAQLLKETRWHRVSEDGEHLLALIRQHHPAPPPPPPPTDASATPLGTVNSNIPRPRTSSTPTTRRCGKCGIVGHIGWSIRDNLNFR